MKLAKQRRWCGWSIYSKFGFVEVLPMWTNIHRKWIVK